ncbi:MAG TPA: hypothetical protein VMW63_09050 [Methanoregulaceae archaeon]|nr:hypothetical protein [Methanoregulaceae archaeon]
MFPKDVHTVAKFLSIAPLAHEYEEVQHHTKVKMHINLKRYGLYLLRWQASTPILAAVGILLATMGQIMAAIVANLIGGLIFFWVDRFIFTSQALAAQWEVKEQITCADCGRVTRGYRLVKSENYDRSHEERPQFRCENCSTRKADELRRKGIRVD